MQLFRPKQRPNQNVLIPIYLQDLYVKIVYKNKTCNCFEAKTEAESKFSMTSGSYNPLKVLTKSN